MKPSLLIAGDPSYGIAQAIAERWPQARFASRKTGYDLCQDEDQKRLAQQSREFDAFINCAALWKFQQTLLLEAVWKSWKDAGKLGRIICLGSTADVGPRASDWLYPVEKQALKALCRNLSLLAQQGSGIGVSYLAFGYVSTPRTLEKHQGKRMMKPEQVVDVVEWVLNGPNQFNINELSLDPCQPTSGR